MNIPNRYKYSKQSPKLNKNPIKQDLLLILVLNTTSRYLDDILNINNVYFDNMVSQIYPSELQLY